jgi:hypothetical protein
MCRSRIRSMWRGGRNCFNHLRQGSSIIYLKLYPHAASVARQASGTHFATDAEYVRFARKLAATAIEDQLDVLTDVCGTVGDLAQRIRMRRRVADEDSCSPENYVDDNDLIALVTFTRRTIYIVSYGSCHVRVISGAAISALPDVQHLSEICFPSDAIVIEFIGSHHNSFPLNATFGPTVVPEPPDPTANATNGTSINAACTSGSSPFRNGPILPPQPQVPAAAASCDDGSFDHTSQATSIASGLKKVTQYFEKNSMDRSTCACCNELKSPAETKLVSATNGPWSVRLRRLSWSHTTFTCSESTQSETKQYYDASQKHDLSTLNDLALSPAGIVQDSDNSWKAILCVSCFRHLGKGKADAPAIRHLKRFVTILRSFPFQRKLRASSQLGRNLAFVHYLR